MSVLTIGDVLIDIEAMRDQPRHPRTRYGDRDPIDPILRRLVYARDGYCCRLCGRRAGTWDFRVRDLVQLQLDHVIPWSAGGPDEATNLRSACAVCNQERSNFRDLVIPRLLPVTAECLRCEVFTDWDEYEGWTTVSAYCGSCDDVGPAFAGEVL